MLTRDMTLRERTKFSLENDVRYYTKVVNDARAKQADPNICTGAGTTLLLELASARVSKEKKWHFPFYTVFSVDTCSSELGQF